MAAVVRATAVDLAIAEHDDAVNAILSRVDASPALQADDRAMVERLAQLARDRLKAGQAIREQIAASGPLTALVEQTSDVILVLDDEDRIRYASPSARVLFGTAVLHGRPLPDLVDPRERRTARHLLRYARRADQGGGGRADWTIRGADGNASRVEVFCRDLRADDAVRGLVVTLRDVTGQRRLESALTRQVFLDPLTGLPNRLFLRDRTSDAVLRNGGVAGLIVLDVDHFRGVNEGLGREAGDEVLIAVSRRIRDWAGPTSVAARIGGDEFAVLIPHVAAPEAGKPVRETIQKTMMELAQHLHSVLAEPVQVGPDAVTMTVSIGISSTMDADNETELLRHADLALDAAKAGGRARSCCYEHPMKDAMTHRQELRSALASAVDSGALVVHYQPIVALGSGATVGFEALVRWNHPTRGLLQPSQFIDIAEESGLIVPIGQYVLRAALETARQWPARPDRAPLYVSVNVSVRQFRAPGFVDTVRRLLTDSGLPPTRLVLEITESLLLRDDDDVWEDLKRLRAIGIRIAIDDFGTGYSALSYLRQVPLDIVKLDRLFTSSMATSPRQRELVRGIVGLITTLHLDVVAEGIETKAQRAISAEVGCGFGQGYLFARPVSAEDTMRYSA